MSHAPELPLPATTFCSVEYPGYISSPSSIPTAIRSLGGQPALDSAFKRAKTKTDALVECSLRPDNAFARRIQGETVGTNKVLMRVVKRRRKVADEEGYVGEFTAEAVGTVPKTARFRAMLDYQYLPDPEDPIAQLRKAMDNMDVDAICKYRMPEDKYEYMVPAPAPTDREGDVQMSDSDSLAGPSKNPSSAGPKMVSNLRMFPPPLLNRQAVFQTYNFRANPNSVVQTIPDPNATTEGGTGEEKTDNDNDRGLKKRLVNRKQYMGMGPSGILFAEPDIPTKPPKALEEHRGSVNKELYKKLEDLFAQRPVWSRNALNAQLTLEEARQVNNSKIYIPLLSWVFHDGPWRDTAIRFGYDPRRERESYIYQRVYFRNISRPVVRASLAERKQERRTAIARESANAAATESGVTRTGTGGEEERRPPAAHIFDGKTLGGESAAFQLCDVTDPMIVSMIESAAEDLRDEPNDRSGWFPAPAYEQIKGVLHHKYFSLADEGRAAPDEECRALLLASAEVKETPSRQSSKIKRGVKPKYAKAKGEGRAEDAAAVRLKAAMRSAGAGG